MKKYALINIFACLVLLSCDKRNEIKPETGFIKANVNGIETVFNAIPLTEDKLNYIETAQNYFAITFYKGELSNVHWALVVSTVDIDKAKLPLTIKGPNPNGQSPEFYTVISDPNGGPYGRVIADARSSDNDISATITSVKGDVIKGTFEGSGFLNGKFQAKLQRLKL